MIEQADQQVLRGRTIVVTRAREQADDLLERLSALGAVPIAFPVIAFAAPEPGGALDQALQRLDSYDWIIFTSANGVRFFFERLKALGIDPAPLAATRLAAIGPATAGELERHGLQPTFVPSRFVAEAVVEQIEGVEQKRVLLPRADIAREALPAGLARRGALVEQVVAYHTLPARSEVDLRSLLRRQQIDAVTFTSSSTVRNFCLRLEQEGLAAEELRGLLREVTVAAIGPITAATVRELGLPVTIEAERYTVEGLVAALCRQLGRARRSQAQQTEQRRSDD